MSDNNNTMTPLAGVVKKPELKIIGAGCGRTGTSSLQEALQILGFGKCYHMREVFKDPNGLSKWEEISEFVSKDGNDPSQISPDIWDDIWRSSFMLRVGSWPNSSCSLSM